MSKYGMMMVCGNSVEELEHDLAMLKMAVASGAMMGCGCCHCEDEDDTPPTIAEILEMVGSGEIDVVEGLDLIHEYYGVED